MGRKENRVFQEVMKGLREGNPQAAKAQAKRDEETRKARRANQALNKKRGLPATGNGDEPIDTGMFS